MGIYDSFVAGVVIPKDLSVIQKLKNDGFSVLTLRNEKNDTLTLVSCRFRDDISSAHKILSESEMKNIAWLNIKVSSSTITYPFIATFNIPGYGIFTDETPPADAYAYK